MFCGTYSLTGFTIIPASGGTITLPYNYFLPTQTVCPNQLFTLAYTGSNGVQQVNWFKWDGANWQVVGVSTDPDFGVNMVGISAPTMFKAQPTACSGTLPAQTITVNVVNQATVAGVALGTRDVLFAANQGTITLADYTGAILNWQSSVDNGTSWLDLAESDEQLPYENLTTNRPLSCVNLQLKIKY